MFDRPTGGRSARCASGRQPRQAAGGSYGSGWYSATKAGIPAASSCGLNLAVLAASSSFELALQCHGYMPRTGWPCPASSPGWMPGEHQLGPDHPDPVAAAGAHGERQRSQGIVRQNGCQSLWSVRAGRSSLCPGARQGCCRASTSAGISRWAARRPGPDDLRAPSPATARDWIGTALPGLRGPAPGVNIPQASPGWPAGASQGGYTTPRGLFGSFQPVAGTGNSDPVCALLKGSLRGLSEAQVLDFLLDVSHHSGRVRGTGEESARRVCRRC